MAGSNFDIISTIQVYICRFLLNGFEESYTSCLFVPRFTFFDNSPGELGEFIHYIYRDIISVRGM